MSFLNARSGYGRRRWSAQATLILLVSSIGVNLILAHRLRAYSEPELGGLPPGAVAPTLEVTSLDGRPVEIRMDERPTIVYYFSPKCAWCEKNWMNVNALVTATGGRYRFVGISALPDVASYMAAHHIPFEVYTGLSSAATRAYRFSGTPQTVVIASDGLVEHAWSGAYSPAQQRSIELAFRMALPGLSASQ
jgi:peroxiredoxin